MVTKTAVRDNRLIDALDALPRTALQGHVWRVVREGRDPCQCSASGGRWDDGTFDVLYTSHTRDGAIAEMYFHLLRGQPVFPSRAHFVLHELDISLTNVLTFSALTELAPLGFDIGRFGQLSYNERLQEYPRSQEIAEVAHFLDCDGIVVPSARWPSTNVVLFCDRLPPGAIEPVKDHGIIDWVDWQKRSKV